MNEADIKWIELKTALVWVVTENSSQVARYLKNPAAFEDEWDWDLGNGPIWAPGWTVLREKIAAGQVKARGEAFEYPSGVVVAPTAVRKSAKLKLPSTPKPLAEFDEDEDGDQNVQQVVLATPMSTLSEIPAREALNLNLDDADGDLSVRPSTWALMGGTAWRLIEISSSDLARSYSNVAQVTDESEKDLTVLPEHLIIQVWRRVVPEGLNSLLSVKEQDRLIINEFKAQGSKLPHSSTIRKVFKEAGIIRHHKRKRK